MDRQFSTPYAQRHRTRPRHGGGGACPYPDTLQPHTGSLSRYRSCGVAARPERQRTTVDCHRIVQKGASTHRSHRLSSVPSPSHAVSGALEYSPPSASHQDTLQGRGKFRPGTISPLLKSPKPQASMHYTEGSKLHQAGTTWSQNCVFQEEPGAPTNAPEPTVSCAAS